MRGLRFVVLFSFISLPWLPCMFEWCFVNKNQGAIDRKDGLVMNVNGNSSYSSEN